MKITIRFIFLLFGLAIMTFGMHDYKGRRNGRRGMGCTNVRLDCKR